MLISRGIYRFFFLGSLFSMNKYSYAPWVILLSVGLHTSFLEAGNNSFPPLNTAFIESVSPQALSDIKSGISRIVSEFKPKLAWQDRRKIKRFVTAIRRYAQLLAEREVLVRQTPENPESFKDYVQVVKAAWKFYWMPSIPAVTKEMEGAASDLKTLNINLIDYAPLAAIIKDILNTIEDNL
jgi:hypothetical protein